jgi:hypothetical protein
MPRKLNAAHSYCMKFTIIMSRSNFFFAEGKLSFILDGYSAGSSGKGKIESWLIKNSTNCSFLATSNSANASHTVVDTVDGELKSIVFKCLPSGSLYHEKLQKVYICAGACFELKALLHEMQEIGIPRSKVGIHPLAAIITQIDIDYELGLCDLNGVYSEERGAGTIATGSTCSGSGTVLAKKVLRNKTLKTAKDFPELSDMICVVELEIMGRLSRGESGLMGIGQGFPLSNNHWRFAPNTTSRNVTVSAGLNDAMLPPDVVGNVLNNGRVFPIKIASYKLETEEAKIARVDVDMKIGVEKSLQLIAYDFPMHLFSAKVIYSSEGAIPYIESAVIEIWSKPNVFINGEEVKKYPQVPYHKIASYSGDFYPDQQEITWEEVEINAGKIPDHIIRTTLTKLPRRVATFSKIALEESIIYNMPPAPYKMFIGLNFVDWVDKGLAGATDAELVKEDSLVANWIGENMSGVVDSHERVTLAFLGTGQETDALIVSPSVSEMVGYPV